MLPADAHRMKPPAPSFGIVAGASYLPPERRSLNDWAKAVGPAQRRLLGSMQDNGLAYYHVAPDMDIEALSCAAVERLLDTSALEPERIDLVLYCHTNSTSMMAAPDSIPATLARRFGMRNAHGHSIAQQNCASLVCALRLLKTLMWRHPALDNVLIVSTDKVFGERFRNVSSYAIQSDTSLAIWVARGYPLNRIGHIAYYIDSRYYRGAAKGPELGQRFALNYPILAHQVMTDVMRAHGWLAGDVDAVLPMNANLSAFTRVMDMLGLPHEKLHSRNIGTIGHMFCCDPFCNFLERFSDPALVASGNAILFASASSGVFSAVGVSDSWTGAVDVAPASVRIPTRQPVSSPLP
ncbi:3-oxoacyl-[acyl-carrier-protein] synthase III C-terminal domain-containing protein [Burkholderia sp. Bp8963]|uniref:3-oxoacyl-[acyl-carrier-protein] synthase III C-terminal domain-containing protein n=1 Tax=Burkholderia sp. Bp8963 TaxID=2184547 RepID=UPI00163B50F3|nr:3-oxoacyl-[acyl-carrier-protein] synthase III C-terminal domain-containing protein [Burkholderia sp. Bp8963]